MTRILEVATSFYPTIGGVETFVAELSKALVRMGFDCQILCAERPGSPVGKDPGPDIPITRLHSKFRLSTTPLAFEWISATRRMLKEDPPDILHAHIPLPGLPDVAISAAEHLGIPIVLSYHNDLVIANFVQAVTIPTYYLLRGLWSLRAAHRIVVETPRYAQDSPWLRWFLDKICVVPPGIKQEFLSEDVMPGFLDREDTIVFVGRLEAGSEYKGLQVLLRAMPIILESIPSARLLVVGGGPKLAYYSAVASKTEASGSISFLGVVPNRTLITALAKAKLFVLPSISRAEGFGIAVLEAQSQGTPVVATSRGGLTYAMLPDKTGLVVPSGDSQALAEAAITLLSDSRKWESFSRAARDFVMDYTWERAAWRYKQVFEEALYARPAARRQH